MNHPVHSTTEIDFSEKPIQFWEQQVHACLGLLAQAKVLCTDELRRTVEGMEIDEIFSSLDYYSRWTIAIAQLCMEKGVLKEEDLDRELGIRSGQAGVDYSFAPGDRVLVRPISGRHALASTRWRRPHLRTPGYIFGQEGTIERFVGSFPNPSLKAFGKTGREEKLFRVRFALKAVWEAAGLEYTAGDTDTVDVEIYANWLLPWTADTAMQLEESAREVQPARPKRARLTEHTATEREAEGESKAHKHTHTHAHTHTSHATREEDEQRAVDTEGHVHDGQEYAEMKLIQALIRALIAQNLITTDDLRKMVETIDTMGSKQEGGRIVARAWVDAEFKERLLKDANAAAKELGIDAQNVNAPTVLTVVENTQDVHNLIVCTLCSCYPAKILGLAPQWYKSRIFRARAVSSPRQVLAEWGTHVPPNVTLRVHDSTADCRYMVLPQRPPATENWSEEELVALVSRDSMLGMCHATNPPDLP